jgi:type II secretory pathway predicted ATPase ExeA
MYERFYGLNQKPFSMNPDPYFLYWGHSHSTAYSMLEYGILNQAGFTVITGDVGSGKTTLLRQLLHNISDGRITVGLIANTLMAQGSLLEWIMLSLNQPFHQEKYVALFHQFQQFLISEYEQGRHTVIIVDEAQNLDFSALEELRMLSNINSDGAQLLQIVLVGQPQLREILMRPELVQFAQRISSDFHLSPLSLEEVSKYIHHRLAVAGGASNLFARGAIQLIAEASGGVPRIINNLCDAALVYGFAVQSRKISRALVQELLDDRRRYGLAQLRDTYSLANDKAS